MISHGGGSLIDRKGGSASSSFTELDLGDPTVDGSWRIRINGTNLVQERRESGVWVEKVAATP